MRSYLRLQFNWMTVIGRTVLLTDGTVMDSEALEMIGDGIVPSHCLLPMPSL